jgi:hypothetical protein
MSQTFTINTETGESHEFAFEDMSESTKAMAQQAMNLQVATDEKRVVVREYTKQIEANQTIINDYVERLTKELIDLPEVVDAPVVAKADAG